MELLINNTTVYSKHLNVEPVFQLNMIALWSVIIKPTASTVFDVELYLNKTKLATFTNYLDDAVGNGITILRYNQPKK